MMRSTLSLVLVCGCALLVGCGKSGPPRGSVSGQVTVGGQPLKAGRVIFTPIAPTQGPATSVRIEAGRYAADRRNGPILGQHRVEVEADLDLGYAIDDEEAYALHAHKPKPPNPIPLEYGRQSKLVTTITADQDNQFDILIPASRR
jgi:hypothetical protein